MTNELDSLNTVFDTTGYIFSDTISDSSMIGLFAADTIADTAIVPDTAFPNFISTLPGGSRYSMPEGSGFKYQPLAQDGRDWIFMVALLGFFILAHTRWLYGRRLKQLLMVFAGERYFHQLNRDGQLPNERISIGLFALYASQLALVLQVFVVNVAGLTYPFSMDFGSYLIILMAIVLFWFARLVIIRVIAMIFDTPDVTRLYIINILSFNFLMGMVLLVASVPLIWSEDMNYQYAYLSLFLVLWVYRIFRNNGVALAERQYSVFFLLVFTSFIELILPAFLIKLASIYYTGIMP